MANNQESGSMTLMDLITSDPNPLSTTATNSSSSLPALGKGVTDQSNKGSKKPSPASSLSADSLSPARLLAPVKNSLVPITKKKKVLL